MIAFCACASSLHVLCGCASAACCEPRYVVSSLYSSGIRGIVTREDPRTLSPLVWLPNNNLIFIFGSWWHCSQIRFSLNTAPISARRRQRLTIDAGLTDKHRRPRMALISSVVAGTPSSGQHTAWGKPTTSHVLFAQRRGCAHIPVDGRPCAAAAKFKGE